MDEKLLTLTDKDIQKIINMANNGVSNINNDCLKELSNEEAEELTMRFDLIYLDDEINKLVLLFDENTTQSQLNYYKEMVDRTLLAVASSIDIYVLLQLENKFNSLSDIIFPMLTIPTIIYSFKLLKDLVQGDRDLITLLKLTLTNLTLIFSGITLIKLGSGGTDKIIPLLLMLPLLQIIMNEIQKDIENYYVIDDTFISLMEELAIKNELINQKTKILKNNKLY